MPLPPFFSRLASSLPFLRRRKRRRGQTLIEVLLAVGIMSTMASFVLSKVDITDVMKKLGTTGEQIAARAIGRAVVQYRLDHRGTLPGPTSALPSAINDTMKPICKQATPQVSCDAAGGVLIDAVTEGDGSLPHIPVHPDFVEETEILTGFHIRVLPSERIEVRGVSATALFVQ